ncbi:regulator [Bacillus sp. FJAT-27231]|uniref:response regulator transcription factor n=1 Tax=Bacillus sp. FJAT-27231 TaxID=1679168 RepID=UPI000670B743|nr:response regulator transcription factor [Bacillus sp. FJAT-27231]KMY53443.1 regulator [Bacillus sp. FJAT-27231]
MNEQLILIVEDEVSIRKFIALNLQRANFSTTEAPNGKEALSIIDKERIGLVILDLNLPDIDGLEVCEKLRAAHPHLPVIILSARGQDMDRITGLELGADDYIVKPFNPLELVARIRSVLRRTESIREPEPLLTSGPLQLNLKEQTLTKHQQPIKLTMREFHLLKVFFSKINEPISRDELLNEVWGENYFGDTKTVDVHIRRLREKIEDDPSHPVFIETVWGCGYRFKRIYT